MAKPDNARSRKVRSTLDHVTRISGEAQHNAMKAEDTLSSLEEREAKRARRSGDTRGGA
jgi:hypothetical protein